MEGKGKDQRQKPRHITSTHRTQEKSCWFTPGTLADSGVQGQDHLGMHKTGGNDLGSCWQTDPVYFDSLFTLGKPPFLKKTSMRTHKPDAKVCCVSEIITSGERSEAGIPEPSCSSQDSGGGVELCSPSR